MGIAKARSAICVRFGMGLANSGERDICEYPRHWSLNVGCKSRLKLSNTAKSKADRQQNRSEAKQTKAIQAKKEIVEAVLLSIINAHHS